MFNFSKTLVAATLIASLGTVSSAAVAGEHTVNANGQRTITVSYGDLNLDQPAGRDVLESRISSAAKKVCGYSNGVVSLQESRQVASCIAGATDTAMAALNDSGQIQVAAR